MNELTLIRDELKLIKREFQAYQIAERARHMDIRKLLEQIRDNLKPKKVPDPTNEENNGEKGEEFKPAVS